MEFLIKTKIRGVYKFVKIEENEFSVYSFIQKGNFFFSFKLFILWTSQKDDLLSNKIVAFAAHNIDMMDEVTIDFYSNDYTAVPENILLDVMKQYRGCGCFYIELVLSDEENKMMTAEVKT